MHKFLVQYLDSGANGYTNGETIKWANNGTNVCTINGADGYTYSYTDGCTNISTDIGPYSDALVLCAECGADQCAYLQGRLQQSRLRRRLHGWR